MDFSSAIALFNAVQFLADLATGMVLSLASAASSLRLTKKYSNYKYFSKKVKSAFLSHPPVKLAFRRAFPFWQASNPVYVVIN